MIKVFVCALLLLLFGIQFALATFDMAQVTSTVGALFGPQQLADQQIQHGFAVIVQRGRAPEFRYFGSISESTTPTPPNGDTVFFI